MSSGDPFHRACPNCKKDLFYKSKKSWYNAKYENNVCRSCTQLGHTPWNKGLNSSDERVKKNLKALQKSWKENYTGRVNKIWNKGLTAKTDDRVKQNVESTRKTLLQLHKEGKIKVWNHGKPFPQVAGDNSPWRRPEVREKAILAAMSLRGKNYKCNFNPKACTLFDEINTEMGWSGIHALNNPNGEHRVFGTNYVVDFFEPNLNIVIEFYEKHHNKPSYIKKDLERQRKIIQSINCHFYIIKEREENLWRQIINKPFWLQAQQGSSALMLPNIA